MRNLVLRRPGPFVEQNIARHRVRPTTFSTYRKQIRLIETELGTITARELRPEGRRIRVRPDP
jgi:hypothetical protein